MQQANSGGHSRKQFQIDRLAFFSDAVIAIAITLMVLEIKIPNLPDKPLGDLIKEYGNAFLLHALALLICFGSIGNLWMRHHELFEHVIDYNRGLIKRNLYFLLGVVLLPVSISYLFSEGSPMRIKLFLYFLNLCIINLLYFFVLASIYNKKQCLTAVDDTELIKRNKRGTLVSSFVFLLVAIVVLQNSQGFYLPFLIFPLIRLVGGIISKRKGMRKLKTGEG